jgi:hypothetical protein
VEVLPNFSHWRFDKGSEGRDMAELFDMKNCGAIAFGDYNKSQDNANLLKIALQYVQDFDGLHFPKTKNKRTWCR